MLFPVYFCKEKRSRLFSPVG